MEIIAFDSHKRYTLCSVENEQGEIIEETRIEHERGALRAHLERFTPGSPVAVETIGNWYGIVDQIEEAGMKPLLARARKAKLMMGNTNKTDRLDVRGLNRLQKNGTLPTVWMPSQGLRDKRDLFRTRMYLVSQRTGLKNRVHAALARHGVVVDASDMFGKRGREELVKGVEYLPEHTRFATEIQLGEIGALENVIDGLEERMRDVFE
jgi:transposase